MTSAPIRYIIPFGAASLAASFAAAIGLFVQGGEVDMARPGEILSQFGAALFVCLPVVVTGGLLVALPLERIALRRLGDTPYFIASVVIAVLASLLVEQILFQGPYASFGAMALPAALAGLAAALVWRKMVRSNDKVTHA